MVVKAKSDDTTRPLKNVSNFSAWQLPPLGESKAPGFQQPVEEVEPEPELTEAELEQIKADELKAIKQAAYQEGFNSGRDAGLHAVKNQVEQESALMLQLMSQLSEPLKQCEEKTQQQLLELAFAIARQIVRRELKQDPTQIIAIIRDALKLLPIGTQKVSISLHPEDARMVEEKLSIGATGAGESSTVSDNRWQINQDPAIERGCCQLTTKNSKIDASIDKQIAVLFSRVAGGLRAGEMESNDSTNEPGAQSNLETEDFNRGVSGNEMNAANGDLADRQATQNTTIKVESPQQTAQQHQPKEPDNE